MINSKKASPNSKVNIALIGCRGVGWQNLSSFVKIPEVEIIALCDVDQNILDKRNGDLEKMIGKKVKEYTDFRKLLEDKDLDAVIIATPDHWHALITIAACEAGKDVYVEKPLANNLEACGAMIKAVRHFGRVCQVGQQQQSGAHWQNAIKFVHSGALGKIRFVKTWAYIAWKSALPATPDEPVPAGLDYDMWLGPAPKKPYNKFRCHYNFRYWWDYAGGMMTDWGVHMLDIALLGMKAAGPGSTMSSGGNFGYPWGVQDTPDTMRAIYDFGEFFLSWEHAVGIGNGPYGREHGVAFLGDNGTLIIDRKGWQVLPEVERSSGSKMEEVAFQPAEDNARDKHALNFIESVKSRKDPICPIEVGANVARVAHLGNIAYRIGRKVSWDPEINQIVNDQEAIDLGNAHYREPWKLNSY